MLYRIHSIRTPRLLLRTYSLSDAPVLQQTIQDNLEHLRPWMPWAHNEPETVQQKEVRIAQWASTFHNHTDVVYGIFCPQSKRLLGGCGFHFRGEPKRYDIGYWLAKSETGKGYARELSYALAQIVLFHLNQLQVDICCKPENLRSAAVPAALGFNLLDTTFETEDKTVLQVWRLQKHNWKSLPQFEPVSCYNDSNETVQIGSIG